MISREALRAEMRAMRDLRKIHRFIVVGAIACALFVTLGFVAGLYFDKAYLFWAPVIATMLFVVFLLTVVQYWIMNADRGFE